MTGRKITRCLPGLFAVSLAVLPAGLRAQHEEPPPPAVYALEGVTVVGPDGSTREGVTLVARGGLVETLRSGAAVPAGARVLEGESLMVYPGLVDAWGEADFEFEDDQGRGRTLSWDPSREAQGFTPHRRVADALTATGDDLEDARRAGVVAQAVHPRGGVAPGRGAVILNRKSAPEPRGLVVNPALGPTLTLSGSRGSYPSTLFGVMAFHRQTFQDAAHMALIRREYQRDPQGLTLPRWDPDHEVYQEAAAGRAPVFFRADGAEDIRRVLGLADEFGFRPVVVGGGEAWKVADQLREKNVPVLVSLDFPQPEEWEPGEGEDEDLEPAAWREKERLEALYANPGRLSEAGVTFALTSGGGDADLREGARKVVEYGLSPEAALAALTTTPARLLGIPNVPRVEEGLAATFVVTDGPIFDEGTSVIYTFVEGEVERGRTGRPGGGEPPSADLSGSWTLTSESPQGGREWSLTLEQDGNALEGSARGGRGGAMQVRNGSVSGDEVSFALRLEVADQTIEIEVNGTIQDPDHFSGTISSGFGSSEFTAERVGGGPGMGGVR